MSRRVIELIIRFIQILIYQLPMMMVAGSTWYLQSIQGLNEVARTSDKRQRLNDAIRDQNKVAIADRLRSCHNWKELDSNGESVLHVAIIGGSSDLNLQKNTVEILQMFLLQKVPVNIRNWRGETAMHLAVKNKMNKVVLFLLKKGACSNSGNKSTCSMAHFIVQNEYEQHRKNQEGESQCYDPNSMKFINWFLSLGVNVDFQNNDGDTALHLAAKYNLVRVIRVLLKYTRNLNAVNKNKKSVLHVFIDNIASCKNVSLSCTNSCNECDIMILKKMMIRGLSIDTVDGLGNTSLHLAAKKCRPDVMKILLVRFRNLDARNRHGLTVLHMLIEHGLRCNDVQHRKQYANTAKTLIRWGAKVNIKSNRGIFPVQLAVMRAHVPILKVMSECDTHFCVLHEKSNLLHLFADQLNKDVSDATYNEIISILVEEGCDINAKNVSGRTPLHLAVQWGCTNIVPWLVKHGANVHSRELKKHRLTPLHEAVIKNDIKMVDALAKAGTDLNARTNSGKSVLHLCTSPDMVRRLLRLGTCLNLADNANHLPFYDAIRRRDLEAVNEMIKFGADVTNVDIGDAVADLPSNSPVLEVIRKHWYKIKAAELPADECYEWGSGSEVSDDVYIGYLTEVQTLKHNRITDRVSLYDFLHMDWNFRCAYVNNKSLKELVDSPNLSAKYREYYALISGCYYEAVARQPLLEPARRAWYQLTQISLPDVCVYRILAHLKNVNLRTMVEGAKDRSYRKPLIVPADTLVKIRNCADAPYV